MDYLEKDFGKILKRNSLKMRRLLLHEGTECMRVYDRNLESFPVTVDLYGKYARITDYSDDGLSDELEEVCCDIVRRMCYIEKAHVIFHRRKKVGKQQHEIQNNNSLKVDVKENGLVFTVDLIKRIDTGLFLDHMKTRQMVREMSEGQRVLNLFSYTGAFSVYAAAGGAKSVDSIDLSTTYSMWANNNLLKNGFELDNYNCIQMDALKFILDAVRASKEYDLIIFDPPSFSNSRKMDETFDVRRDYVRYFNLLNNLLSDDGVLIFSTNLSGFQMDTGRVKGFEVKQITKEILAPGFTKKIGASRTWILRKTKKVRLQKKDYEGKVFTYNAKDSVYKQKNEDFLMNENEKDELVGSESLTPVFDDEKQDTNNYDKLIENLDNEDEVTTDMLQIVWDDSETPKSRDRKKPSEVKSLKNREYQSDNRSFDDEFPRERRTERRDDRRSSFRGSRRDDDRRGSFRGSRRDDDRRDSFRGSRRDDDRRDSFRGSRRDDDRRDSFRGSRRDDDRRDSFRGSRRDDDRRDSFRGSRRDDDRRDSFRGSRRDDDRRDSFRGPRRDDERRDSFRGPRRDDDRRDSFRGPRRDDERRDSFRGPRRDDERRDSFRGPRRDDERRDSFRGSRRDDDRRGSFRGSRDGGERRFNGDRKGSFKDSHRFDRAEGFSKDSNDNSSRKRVKKSGPKPYGFDSVKKTRTRGENEKDFFWLDSNRK